MAQHPIEGLMQTAMENLKQMIDVNTIIGDPVETPDGSVILTISKVGFGFVAGGSEFNTTQKDSTNKATEQQGNNSKDHPFGGGSGGGVSITPIAFLVVNSSGVKMIHVDEQTHLIEKLIDYAPQAVEKIQGMLSSNKNKQGQTKNSTEQSEKQDLDF
jgi:sporulation protein YtfJ